MSKKIFLFSLTLTFLVAGVFLFFNIVKAEEKKSPAENSLCWTRKQCKEQRKNFPGDGFIQDEECRGNALNDPTKPDYDWGKCLAGAMTTAQVSFGGNVKFANIGDYIKTVYSYSLVILSILASIMIIIAGIQYISSAGSQEMISSAKKKIAGALIGLALAYMSYTILNMINPATINLRLPQVYMIRPIMILANWCSAIDKPENVTANFVQTDKSFEIFQEAYKSKKIFENYKLSKPHETVEKNHTKCGAEYNVFLDGSAENCVGFSCDGRVLYEENILLTCNSDNATMCVCVRSDDNPTGFTCKRGLLGGSLNVYKNDKEIYLDDIWLYPVCEKEGKSKYLDYKPNSISLVEYNVDLGKDSQNYIFGVTTEGINNFCKSTGGELKGYLMIVEIHDNWGSKDDRFLVTADNCGNDFSPKVGSEELNDINGPLEAVNYYILKNDYEEKFVDYYHANFAKYKENDLIKFKDIIQNSSNIIIPGQNGTFSCNIIISQSIENKIKDTSKGIFESELIFW